ncbi:MAG: MBL fold metallo-hydrolase [Candidatus Bruticola sp.]
MAELVQVADNTYYIDLMSKVGLYIPEPGQAILIDTSNAESAKDIIAILKERNLKLRCILNTHSHSDHIGSNRALQDEYQCPIYANGLETAFINEPLLAACYLYGGYPYKILRHQFFMAKPSRCSDFKEADLPARFELSMLEGHAMHMTAIRTPDNVWFTGDIACAPEVLNRYPIAFTYNTGQYLESLNEARKLRGELFICAHAKPTTDLNYLLDYNRQVMENIFEAIKASCANGEKNFELIAKDVFDHFQMHASQMIYGNAAPTLRSHISYLVDAHQLKVIAKDNMIKFALQS